MKAMPVYEGAFTVLMTFSCKPAESEQFANELADFIEQRLRRHPGFLSGLVYVSEDACTVVELFQWARSGDWDTYRATEDGRAAVQWLSGRKPEVHFLEMVRSIPMAPPGESGTFRSIELPDST
jgi:quinol monooxygenase YgiN